MSGMEEDTSDKIRRNLLVYGALIIFFWIADVSEKELLARVVGQPTNLPKWGVQLICILILVYLMLRYRFADPYSCFIKSRNGGLHDFNRKLTQNLVVNDLVSCGLGQTKFETLTEPSKELVMMLSEFGHGKSHSDLKTSLKAITQWGWIDANGSYSASSCWSGTVTLSDSSPHHIETKFFHSPIEVKFSNDGCGRIITACKSHIKLCLYSKTLAEYLIPLAIGWFAFGLLLIMFIKNLFNL